MTKKYRGTHYWSSGFENYFWIPATKDSLKAEIEHSKGLTWVKRTVIIDESTGETIYDEQNQTPQATARKEDGTSDRTEKKKAVRKKVRTND